MARQSAMPKRAKAQMQKRRMIMPCHKETQTKPPPSAHVAWLLPVRPHAVATVLNAHKARESGSSWIQLGAMHGDDHGADALDAVRARPQPAEWSAESMAHLCAASDMFAYYHAAGLLAPAGKRS